MIEIICKEGQNKEQEEAVGITPPKNIRQVGSPRGRHKVYVEDYVYTYLRTIAQNKENCAAVLLGKSRVAKDLRYTFISGAIECGQAVFQWEKIMLDESFWDYIYKEQKKYFEESEIVGWFIGKQGKSLELQPAIEAAHRKYFAGRDKVLMLMDITEGEELIYVNEQGYLQKREGYYIYYEKNIFMQEYMVSKKEEENKLLLLSEQESILWGEGVEPNLLMQSEAVQKTEIPETSQKEWEELRKEIEDTETAQEPQIFVKSSLEESKTQAEQALQSYRSMVLDKKGKQAEKQSRKLLYTAASFFMILICVIGITTINNYRKMKEVESALHVIKTSVEGTDEKKGTEGEEELKVESVESQVQPLDSQAQPEAVQAGAAQTDNSGQTQNQIQDSGQTQNVTPEPPVPEPPVQEPAAPPAPDPQPAAEPKYYTVLAGDTLESICLKLYNSKDIMNTLCQLNGIENGNKIKAGQKLLLP